MTRTQLLITRKNLIVWGAVALGVLLIGGLLYAPGTIWRLGAWILFGATAVIVLVVLGNLLFAVVSLETGYRADNASSHPVSVPTAPETPPIPVMPKPALSVARSTQFEEALADLRAAQYLLSKVQAGGAFREFSETQRRECDHALEEVRALLGDVAREKTIQKFAS